MIRLVLFLYLLTFTACSGKFSVAFDEEQLSGSAAEPEENGESGAPGDESNEEPIPEPETPANEQAEELASSYVLGQVSATTVRKFTHGMNGGEGVFSNGTNLIVVDTDNHRVLIWNTIPSASTQPADLVLGQPNLSSVGPNTGGLSASSLFEPTYAYSDGTRLYVSDTSNHRVLIWNTFPVESGQAANLVLGQPSFFSNGENHGGISGKSFNEPKGIYSNGTSLFVADDNNNRVLVWNSIPTSSGASADFAMGQPNLVSDTANNPSLSGTSLSDPSHLSSDGTILLVADDENHRVLLWNNLPTASTDSADLALGQPNLTSNAVNNGGLSPTSMQRPSSVHTDGTRIVVSDTFNNRVLIWDSIPLVSGTAANRVLGQPNFNTNAANNGGMSATSIDYPKGIYFDNNQMILADQDNNRMLLWQNFPSVSNQAANLVLGQPDFVSNGVNHPGVDATHLDSPRAAFYDGTRFFVADRINNRVLVWNSLPQDSGVPADFALGQPDLISNTPNNGGRSEHTLSQPNAVFSDGTRLFVSDTNNHRVLIWTTMPTSSGEGADLVLGQPSFAAGAFNNGGISASTLYTPRGIVFDGTRLLVVDEDNHRILVWNSLPMVDREPANFALGQPDLISGVDNNGGVSASSLSFPKDVHVDDGSVFVTDNDNNRLLIWDSFPTVSGEPADIVIGQTSFNTNDANSGGRSSSTFNDPYGVTSNGTQLFVSDEDNNRILVWDSIPAFSGQRADHVIGQPDFTSNTDNTFGVSEQSINSPKGLQIAGNYLFVVDEVNDRVVIWDDIFSQISD